MDNSLAIVSDQPVVVIQFINYMVGQYTPLARVESSYSFFEVASTCLLVYDWIICLGPEIEFIWRSKWSLGRLLYHCNRIGPVLLFGYVDHASSIERMIRERPMPG
ncbi:hypothetical protein RSAG8_10171, partial [Rhizoctonia solani AG-8 WAC10335]